MPEDAIVSDLVSLGLHQNEAKAYKTLVAIGQSQASQVAKVAKVPRSKVYEVLYSLETKGMIRKILGKEPMEFRAYSPKDAIPHLMEKIENSSKSVLSSLESMHKDIESNNREFAWTEVGEEQIKMGTRSSISSARKEVFIATRDTQLLRLLKPSLAAARKRGIDIKLVATGLVEEELEAYTHYATIIDMKNIGSEVLIENLAKVLQDSSLENAGWDPNQISIIIIDNSHSIAIFKSDSEANKPWALHIHNPLIVIFQRQVITSLLAAIDQLPFVVNPKK
jgi:sugar-specific transcriptional regulator TrmB